MCDESTRGDSGLPLIDRKETVIQLENRGIDGRCVYRADVPHFPTAGRGLFPDDFAANGIEIVVPSSCPPGDT